MTTQSHSQITDAERMRRQQAVDFARTSVGLEGLQIDAIEEARAKRFIDGEISLSEFLAAPNGNGK